MDAPTLFDADADGPTLASRFPGEAFDAEHDLARLTGQLLRVHNVMARGGWWTVAEIAARTGDPQPSVQAQVGHLRKAKFGAYLVERRHRGDRSAGLFEYRLGAKGAGVPRPHTCRRSDELAAALGELVPDHPLLTGSA
jgi:hypothetical protein